MTQSASDSPQLSLLQNLCDSIDRHADQLVEFRRELHRYPEVSGQEYDTTQRIVDRLVQAGITPNISPSKRGVVCDLISDASQESSGQGLLLRADMDALPINDQKEEIYRSQNAGFMHACGHDAHTAMLYGAALAIHETQQQVPTYFTRPLRIAFQPAEEICEGAQQMIREGVTEGIEAALALHVDPSQPFGFIGYRHGLLTAICDELMIDVQGKGGHGARPHLTCDPIFATTQFIQSAYSQIPRALNAQSPHVLSFCQVQSGHSANAVPEAAHIRGTLRTLDVDEREKAIRQLTALCASVGEQTGCKLTLRTGIHAPAVKNDPNLTDLFVQAANDLLPKDQVHSIQRPSMGGEDFAYFGTQCLTAMVRVGCRPPHVPALDLHSPEFDIDERILPLGAKLLAWASLRWMRLAKAGEASL